MIVTETWNNMSIFIACTFPADGVAPHVYMPGSV